MHDHVVNARRKLTKVKRVSASFPLSLHSRLFLNVLTSLSNIAGEGARPVSFNSDQPVTSNSLSNPIFTILRQWPLKFNINISQMFNPD